MDVSTGILDDEKFQRLALKSPEHFAPAVVGFVATLARSWRKGQRIKVHDAWPVYRPFVQEAVDALIDVKLLDKTGRIPATPWREWFQEANRRRSETRAKWRKDKQNERDRQRGVSADSVLDPRSPTVRPSVPSDPSSRARGGRMTSFANEMEKHGFGSRKTATA